MKYVGLLKIFDSELSSTWHNGSATSYKGKSDFDTKEEAEEWIYEQHYSKYRADKYKVTECVLAYDESQSENVKDFFKYL